MAAALINPCAVSCFKVSNSVYLGRGCPVIPVDARRKSTGSGAAVGLGRHDLSVVTSILAAMPAIDPRERLERFVLCARRMMAHSLVREQRKLLEDLAAGNRRPHGSGLCGPLSRNAKPVARSARRLSAATTSVSDPTTRTFVRARVTAV